MRCIALAVLLSVGLATADAAVILQYETADSETSPFLTPSAQDAAVAGDNMTAGVGLNVNAAGSTWNWRDWDVANASYAEAVAAGDLWSWGFDVVTSNVVDLSALAIRVDRSGTGPTAFEIQASVNGGTGISLLTHDFGSSSSGVTFPDIDLSAIPDLVMGDSVMFTLAAFNSTSASGTFDLEAFNSSSPLALSIEGTVSSAAVPEPSSVGLCAVALAGLGLGFWRRRRAAAAGV